MSVVSDWKLDLGRVSPGKLPGEGESGKCEPTSEEGEEHTG